MLPMRRLLFGRKVPTRHVRFVATSTQTPRGADAVEPMSNSIPRDVQEFIADYSGVENNRHIDDNLRFYRGELEVRMGGRRYSIDSFHDAWQGDYDSLGMLYYYHLLSHEFATHQAPRLPESAHDFIQWMYALLTYCPYFATDLNNIAFPLGSME